MRTAVETIEKNSSLKSLVQGQRSEELNLSEYEQTDVTALESEHFPFEELSNIAERESWRKEVNRPIYHIHKWWAQRLGTVFRAIIIGTFSEKDADMMEKFYKPSRFPEKIVFDPFMGSGTTLGEALKLGARGIGRDINSVAYFLVRNALAIHKRQDVERVFADIEKDVAERVKQYYKTTLPDGQRADVLYYFWVKQVDCPNCDKPVDLFSSRIFARHAYPKKHPKSHSICPSCDAINEINYSDEQVSCKKCKTLYNPQEGAANGQNACCAKCAHVFPIAKTVRKKETPPAHKMYAKLVLLPDGTKQYQSITNEDISLYNKACEALSKHPNPYPIVAIDPGYNTNQALGYNYKYWHNMFNDRQLLCISLIADRIRKIPERNLRDLFACLLSGTLEFNNMFTSYKGEGTGAVRHMFSHHILKPSKVPLEANIWGTPKSSGSFSTLFASRLKRALDYADKPFELLLRDHKGKTQAEKVFGASERIGFDIADNYDDFEKNSKVYLSCGDSSVTDLQAKSVDAVITDPPFFDNVYYSQLADFFYVWQRHILGGNNGREISTTRSAKEVQNNNVATFTENLGNVFSETNRVLKDDGLLAFTYHHSRSDGWSSILEAIMKAGFIITAAQPIKAEMSGAVPKHQAKEPIDIDVILVCRKRLLKQHRIWNGDLWGYVKSIAEGQITRFHKAKRRMSRNDVRVIVMAQLIRSLSTSRTIDSALNILESSNQEIEAEITRIYTMINGEN